MPKPHQTMRRAQVGYASVPKMWPGETIACIASGPSLTREDVEAVHGRARVVVVNTTYQMAPWADVLYGADAHWWTQHKGAPSFLGLKYTLTRHSTLWPGVQLLERGGLEGLASSPSRLNTGGNGGFQAINLAVHLGAARIVLLGYDMQIGPHGKQHWHPDHPNKTVSPYPMFRRHMATLVAPLEKLGIEMVNCTRETALTCFPCAPLEDVFPVAESVAS